MAHRLPSPWPKGGPNQRVQSSKRGSVACSWMLVSIYADNPLLGFCMDSALRVAGCTFESYRSVTGLCFVALGDPTRVVSAVFIRFHVSIMLFALHTACTLLLR